MREIQEEISSIKRQVNSSSRMVDQNGEDGFDICEGNKSGAIHIDSICQEPRILKSKEHMEDGPRESIQAHFLKKIHVPEKINPMQINYLIWMMFLKRTKEKMSRI